MKHRLTFLVLAIGLAGWPSLTRAQPGAAVTPEDPAHQELRAIKDAFVSSFNRRDYDGFLRYLHPNVVATWQNAEVVRRPEGVKAFMKKMSEGDARKVESAQATVTVDELASLYNEQRTGIAYGDLVQDFKFTDGSAVVLKSRWTATFIKENGQWWLSAVHVSANLFESPVLDMIVRSTMRWTGAIAGVLGLVGGLLIARLRKSKRSPA